MPRPIRFALVGLTSALAGAGCETCPDTAPDNGGVLLAPKGNCSQNMAKYDSDDLVGKYQDWSHGQNVAVRNRYGPVRISMGGVDEGLRVHVSVTSFTYALWEEDALRRLRANDALVQSVPFVDVDQLGNIVFDVTTNGEIGYNARARLPVGFDGALTVTADRGDIEYWDYGGSSRAMGSKVHSDSGNVLASTYPGANLTIEGKAERGSVSFSGAFKEISLSPDGTRGTAVVGNGAGSLVASTSNGDIKFQLRPPFYER